MAFTATGVFFGILQQIWAVFLLVWWIVIPVALFFIFINFWLFYVSSYYKKKIKWTALRVRVPKEVVKSAKAMEQVFAAAHGTYSFGIKFHEKWWQGRVENWTSFEIVAHSGGVAFYVYINGDYRDMIEAAIYSQYPDAEIEQVEDYAKIPPAILPNENYDLYGADFILAKDNAYPIRTYEYFEPNRKEGEEEKIDPLANLMEALSRLKNEELAWLQILVRPINNKWAEKALKERDKLMGRKSPPSAPGFLDHAFSWLQNFINAFFTPAEELKWPEKAKEERISSEKLSRYEEEIIKAIENKTSKIAFETVTRFVYIDDKKTFSRSNIAAITAAFRVFNQERLNGLKPNRDTFTVIARPPFKKIKKHYKKRKIYNRYRIREFPDKFSIMNTEELATIYHFPTVAVEAPMLRKVESRRGEPPLSLPVEE